MPLVTRPRAAVTALLVLALLAGACGSSRSVEDIALAAQGVDPDALAARGPGAVVAPNDGGTAAIAAGDGGASGSATSPTTATNTSGTAAASAAGSTAGTTAGTTAGGARPAAGSGAGGAPGASPSGGSGTTGSTSGGVPNSGSASGAAATPSGGPEASQPAPEGEGGQPAAAPDGGPKAPIRIGSVGALSGPAGAVLAPMTEAVQVWAAHVNASGGVNGHPVEVLVADDGGDPRRQREIVQDYVENQGVIAFVGSPSALSQQGSIDYLEQVGVPVVGTDGGNDFPYSRPIIRPQFPHGETLARTSANVAGASAQARGLTRVGTMLCVEVATCQAVRPQAEDVLPRYGAELVYNGDVSLTQPDFTAECLNAAGAGVELMILSLDSASVRRLAASCARQGFTPFYATLTTTLNDSIREDPNLTKLLLGSESPVWTDRTQPAVAEMLQAYETYAPGTVVQPTAIKGWTAAKLFEAATGSLPEPATSQDVIAGLDQIRDNDLGGLTYPLSFFPGEPAERVVCWHIVLIENQQFVAGGDGQITCE